jgi:hypothetical protein
MRLQPGAQGRLVGQDFCLGNRDAEACGLGQKLATSADGGEVLRGSEGALDESPDAGGLAGLAGVETVKTLGGVIIA